jgi:hypothetical protein
MPQLPAMIGFGTAFVFGWLSPAERLALRMEAALAMHSFSLSR